jgi:hypothetical protein
MKSIHSIFKKKSYLLNEPEVQELIDYCDDLQSQLIDIKQSEQFSKEDIFKEMIREILVGCDEILEGQDIDYKKMIENLKFYIKTNCEEYNIRL